MATEKEVTPKSFNMISQGIGHTKKLRIFFRYLLYKILSSLLFPEYSSGGFFAQGVLLKLYLFPIIEIVQKTQS
jgi:hypothetical protein